MGDKRARVLGMPSALSEYGRRLSKEIGLSLKETRTRNRAQGVSKRLKESGADKEGLGEVRARA